MEPARKPHKQDHDLFATRPQRSRSWMEIGHCVDRGKDVACELLLSEMSFAITMLHTATLAGTRPEAARLRNKARELYDAVEHWMPRLDVQDERAGRLSARLCELRWRLEAVGEKF